MRRSVEEMVRLAAAGGGFRVSYRHYPVADLVRMAAAGGPHKGTLTVTDAEDKPIEELIRIAAAGQGTVVFGSPE